MRKRTTTTNEAPRGFEYYSDVISPIEERELSERRFFKLPLEPIKFRGQLSKRRKYSFGWSYDYTRRVTTPMALPIPEWLIPLREKGAALVNYGDESAFNQATVTLYDGDARIGPHHDHVEIYGPVIFGVSLLSAVNLVFEKDKERYVKRLLPRSLYVLRDEARYVWYHSTGKVENPPRLSITFRSVK